ncbi:MAG TPA: LD-carboxypeptidase [Candidatus Sulfotelmatobacter sp.]|jgi:muramoyltetrapeptide carboxypeptidase|nr:LD-carboxypeptidase [Candidatus Sulfotelmatobacter sp.]
MKRYIPKLQKPKALRKGSRLGIVSPSSPGEAAAISAGVAELRRLGFQVEEPASMEPQGYFAGSHDARLQQFCKTVHDKHIDGVIASRGGYGANYLIDSRLATRLQDPKCMVGFSDFNIIQLLMAEARGWAGFYGPMVGTGFSHGADRPSGYDLVSFLQAVSETKSKWKIPLCGQALVSGSASGRIVGGCLTMLQTTLGTGFEPNTSGAILVLEDRGMKPYQVDRALRHLYQAGIFEKVEGILLGDFPDCDPPSTDSPIVPEICAEILGPLDVPIVYGAPIGHTKRAMLTIPLGVRAKLVAKGEGTLEILEPAVVE